MLSRDRATRTESRSSTNGRTSAHGGASPDHADLPDHRLVELFRSGDQTVTGELFARHRDAAARVARQLVRSRADVDDIVSDAFSRVFTAIDNGHGPTENFRGYLYTAVRSSACRRHRDARRLVLSSQQQHVVDIETSADPVLETFDRTAAGRAYGALPERWQTVLWLVDVEDRPAAEVAKILGMTPNAVAALSYRAREGLRQGFLSAHSREPIAPDADCQPIRPLLSPYVRSRTSARDTLRVERHLEHCDDCTELLAELRTVNTTILHGIAPLLIPVGAIAALRAAPSWLPGASGGVGAVGATASATAVRSVTTGALQSGSKLALPFHLPAAVVGGVGAVATAAAVAAVVMFGQHTPPPVEEALVVEATSTSVAAAPPVTAPLVPDLRPPDAPTPAVVESTAAVTVPSPAPTPTTTTTVVESGPTPPTTTLAAEPTAPVVEAPPSPVGVMSVSQVGPLAPGGVGHVLVELSHLSTDRPLRLSWTAPAGFEVRSGRAGTGGCDEGGCELSSDPSGNSVVSLAIAAAPSGVPLTSQPSLHAAGIEDLPALEIVLSDPTHRLGTVAEQLPLATSSSAFTTRFAGVGELALTATGNSVLTCTGGSDCADAAASNTTGGSNDLWPLVQVDTDADHTTVNSSTAALTLPAGGRIVHAELVWGGQHKASSTGMDPSTVRVDLGAGPFDLRADTVLHGEEYAYQSGVDVTALLTEAIGQRSSLDVTVGNVAVTTRTGAWGGWALAVVVEHPDLPRRATILALGFDPGGNELSLMPGRTSRLDELLAIQWDGDPDHGPDGIEVIGGGRPPLAIADGANPLGDLANSTVSIRGVRPAGVPANTFGLDVDVIRVDDGPRTDLGLRTSTGPERSFAGLLGATIALD